MEMVNVHEAKTHLSRLLERVHAGEEIIIAKAGKPFARLVPLGTQDERTPGLYPDETPDSFFDELPEDELGAWNR
jgi:prevent-host-death family protein